jgi:Tfp pilus assembly protein PilV
MTRRSLRGFSYIEVLLSVVLLGVLLVPAMEALQTGIMGTQAATLTQRHLYLRDKMEGVLARPFYELYALTYQSGGNTTAINASLSDAVGATHRRNVVVYRYNPASAALSGNDTGVLAVSVFYEDQPAMALNTLVGRWW